MIKYVCTTEVKEAYGHPWFRFGGDFFYNYFRILEQLAVMDQTYRNEDGKLLAVPYIDWSKSFFVDNNNIVEHISWDTSSSYLDKEYNPWYEWFIEPNITNITSEIISESYYEHRLLKSDGNFWRDDNPINYYYKKINAKFNILRPHIIQKINNFYNNNLKGSTILGVIANFKQDETLHNLSDSKDLNWYLYTIKRLLNENPEIDKVFLITNDEIAVDIFVDKIPNIIYCDVFRRSWSKAHNKSDQANFWTFNPYWWADTVRPNHGVLLGEEFLIQAHLMAKCKVILARQSWLLNGVMLLNENIKKIVGNLKTEDDLVLNKQIADYCISKDFWEFKRNQWSEKKSNIK